MKTKRKVLLFEDSKEERPGIIASLKKALPKDVEVVPFLGTGNAKTGTYEARILKDFKDEIAQAELIICDQDLSTISPSYKGLSAQVITAIAHAEGIPLALYGRGPEDYMMKRMKERRPFFERRFILHLDSVGWDTEKFAKKSRIILDGCQQIRQFIEAHLGRDGKKLSDGTPAKWMSKLLDKPEIINRLGLYGSGDQQYLSSLVASAKQGFAAKGVRVLAAELSYWLWDSLLRFPGITVNKVAAASALNLSKEAWEHANTQTLFAPATYRGPFGVDKKFWWRDELQSIVEKNGVEDGFQLLKLKKMKHAEASRCSVKPSMPAGYYCMLSEKPVALENCHGEIPYFPAGADLARISRKEFAKVAPWAGLKVT